MRPSPHRVRRAALGLVLAVLTGLVAGGGSLVAPDPGAVSPAQALGPTKTIIRSATFSTVNQNMWGTGASTPLDQTLTLFNETWDESDGFDGVEGGCLSFGELGSICGDFGASFDASVSGEIGMSIVLEGLEGGTLTVTYPVTITFTAPADNSFNPGDTVDIKTSIVVDEANATIVAHFPDINKIALNGVFVFNASASGEFCVFDCSDGEIFDIGFDEEGELFSFDPTAINGCFNILINFPFGLSQYPNTRCSNNGYIFNPDPAVTSTFHPGNGTISATGSDQYVVIPVSAVTWAGRLAGLPPYLQLNLGTVNLGGVTIGWTTFNVIITALETMKQDFLFTPRVDVDLNWGKSLNYKTRDGISDAELTAGTASHVTFKAGDTLQLTSNALNNKVIPILPSLSMGSAVMANNTRSSTSGDLTLNALSFTIGTPPWRVCLGDLGCGTIWDGATESWGPHGSGPGPEAKAGDDPAPGCAAPQARGSEAFVRPFARRRDLPCTPAREPPPIDVAVDPAPSSRGDTLEGSRRDNVVFTCG